MPPLVLIAGIFAIVGVLPELLFSGFAIVMSTDGGPVSWPNYLVLLLPPLQLTGAILLLCRRSWLFCALACLPGIGLVVLLAWLSGGEATVFAGPAGALLFTVAAFVAVLMPGVRRWVRTRPRRSATRPVPGSELPPWPA